MKNGAERFEHYLLALDELLKQASKEKNPALWLYSNDARTPLFMLEGLSKLYSGLHNKKRFEKMGEDFKLLEDTLGAIDYYDAFAKEFDGKPAIPQQATAYLHAQSREKVERLNEILEERGWLGQEAKRMNKIREKLSDADWKKDVEEIRGFCEYYDDAIGDINEFFAETNCEFTDLETQVHDLRRKLRWLSIYPRALQGAIQLTSRSVAASELQQYLTADIINSPFNKMPEPGDNRNFLLLEKNYFLALSWMIAELGKLKDDGLRIAALTEALQQTSHLSQPVAQEEAYALVEATQEGTAAILKRSSGLCATYHKEGNLDKLVAGIAIDSDH